MKTPARTSVTPVSSQAKRAVGVEPTLTTGHGRPADRKLSAAFTAAPRSFRALLRWMIDGVGGEWKVEDLDATGRLHQLPFLP